MPRDLVLGNGNLLVCLDRNLFIRDLYWPYVGLYNHVSGRLVRFGIWVDGQFSWIDASWDRDLRYTPETLTTQCRLRNERLRITLLVSDAVDHRADVFVRRIVLQDLSGRQRNARLFLAPDTVICETDIGDTCYYDPFADAVIHYKRDNYLLWGGAGENGRLHGWACGIKGFGGREGTWRDCEDGTLSGNLVAQGSVDSALSISATIPGDGATHPCWFWLTVGKNRETVLELQRKMQEETPAVAHRTTEQYWRSWVFQGPSAVISPVGKNPEEWLDLLPKRVRIQFRRSLLLIRTQIDNRGAILAANDTDIMRTNRAHYSYLWPRDGALVAHALDGVGFGSLTRKFFRFCQTILPPDRGAFLQKYGPDGSLGATWHAFVAPNGQPEIPVQEDETALVIWALAYHYERHRDFEFVEELYGGLARRCADFLLEYRSPETGLPLPSWDLWEERRGVHTFTVCAVIAALRAAARLARLFGDEDREIDYANAAEEVLAAMTTHLWQPEQARFARRLELLADGSAVPDMNQDASLHALHLFDVLPTDHPMVVSTMEQINDRLWVKAGIGGMARYEGDYYARISNDLVSVPGNPWILCTLWKAQWQIASAKTIADLQDPCDLLEWANLCALPSGVLPEQIHPFNFTPTTVAPLTWSHSEFVETVYKWLKKYTELSVGQPDPAGTEI
ncbi:MAG: glycoside hydrolase family 15 protein [Capsulimonadales bacterium]|nr:glycoside hydrolase family 15 protein [Capsulimonadales bacterium]